MARAGQELVGPGGMRLLLVRTGVDTGGELLEMEAIYPGAGSMPPEHLHPLQLERFHVFEGSILAIVAGVERTVVAGEDLEIQPSTPHRMAAREPARVRWEVRPALRTGEFFEGLYRGAAAADPQGFLDGFRDEIRLTSA